MDPERWKQVESVVQAVLDRPAAEREPFLRRQCAGDDALEREVRSLLSVEHPAGKFLENPALEAAAKALARENGQEAQERDGSWIGRTVSHYSILEKVGEGGMGVVWKARDTRLDRFVALKFLPADRMMDSGQRRRFLQEAQAASALNHPNIVTVYDIDEIDADSSFIAMEFVPGESLDQLIARKRLRLNEALDCIIQVADALEAAHQAGIVHRDLKPGNIMVRPDGCIKVVDFGLAKLLVQGADGEPREISATGVSILPRALGWGSQEGMIAGTASYMSPEQAEGRKLDARTDIFSFGAVLYEVVTGRRAFDGDSVASTISAVLRDQPKPVTQIVHGIPRDLERIVTRCLEKSAGRRYQHAGDLKIDLQQVKDDLITSGSALPTTPEPRRQYWWWVAAGGRRWKAAAAASLVLGILASGLGVWAVERFRRAGSTDRAYRFEIQPLPESRVYLSGAGGGIALSPDGTAAVVTLRTNGKIALWLRALDGTTRILAETEGAPEPFWSPDSKSIGFFVGTELQRIDIAGGAPLTICTVPNGVRGGAWSTDGYILFTSIGSPIFRVPVSGGIPTRLTNLDASRGEISHYWPQALPGGHFLYWVQSQKHENAGVYVASLTDPLQRVQLLSTDTNALYARGTNGLDYLLWRRGTTLMAQQFDLAALKLTGEPRPLADPVSSIGSQGYAEVSVSGNGLILYDASSTVGQFTWFDREGKRLGVVGEPGSYSNFRLAPDDRRIVAARNSDTGSDLWLLEAERGVASRFTSGPGVSAWPVWSPDGRAIVFSGSARNLFRKAASGAGDAQIVTRSPFLQNPLDWSRDGRFVLYYQSEDGRRDLWVQPMTPEGKVAGGPTPYLRTPFNEWHARFSPEPNPRWVAYDSDESGRFEIYVQAFPQARGAGRISTAGGTFPHWTSGGREIVYRSPDNKLMSVSLKIGTDAIEPSAPRVLFPLPEVDNGVDPYEITADGQRFLIPAEDLAPQPLHVIVNWPALLHGPSTQPR